MKITYKIDPAHSNVNFVVRHMMITNVRGGFAGIQGTVVYDPENPGASSIENIIDVNSLWTNDAQRDAHLKSGDFLDAEHFPTITFKSRKVEGSGEEWKVTGDLTIRGVTKEVVLKVEGPTEETKDPWGNVRSGASATTKIKRSEFGLNWNVALEAGGFLVGDELKIELEVSLIREQTATA